MVVRVNIILDEKKMKVKFRYNTDLVEIMQDFNGWFIRAEKAWQFPSSKFTTIRDTLKQKMYNVNVIKSKVL